MVKKYIPLIAFLITALLFTFSQAYAYTEITDCTTITSPGEYRLTQDIIDAGVSVCIDIQSDDVVLDCQGHIIEGIGDTGIGVYDRRNLTIKNCVLKDWSYDISISRASNVKILNSQSSVAVELYYVNDCYLENVTFYGWLGIDVLRDCYLNNLRYFDGEIEMRAVNNVTINNFTGLNISSVWIYGGSYLNFTNSYIDTYGINIRNLEDSNFNNIIIVRGGIRLRDVDFSNLNNIEIHGIYEETYYGSFHSYYGIYAEYSNYNNFTNITINNFKHEGIWLGRWSSGNIFTNISISDIVGGEGIGVYVWRESNENYFKGLTIRNTSYAGIFVDYYPANNVFEDFTISDITGSGIWLISVPDTNEFRNGRIERTGYGIRLEDAANQVFHGIIIRNTEECGIHLWNSGYNLFYNNIFMNRNNTCFYTPIYPNYWNTTLRRGKNILGGPFIGGNFWGRPDGKSILDELKYAIIDGIYGHPYDLLGDGTNVDYHPLARVMFVVPPIFKSLVGLGMGIAFIMGAITLLFGIDFFKTKNPFVAIVMAMIGLAVMLLMFAYLWEML